MKKECKGILFIVNNDADLNCPDLVAKALQGCIHAIQFRHKGPFTKKAFNEANEIADLCQRHNVPLFINDRIEIALAVGAAGVHLGQTDMPINIARKLLGQTKIIGATASSLQEALLAQEEGADYIGFGHIFPTKTKIKLTPPIGLEKLSDVCKLIDIPVIAIGGINAYNLKGVLEAGADGIALSSAIAHSENPLLTTQQLITIFQAYAPTTIS